MENNSLDIHVPSDEGETKLDVAEAPKRKVGRPKGAKNKDTLFKELMAGKFESIAQKEMKKVFSVLFEKAAEGDMKAIKMIMDRIVPPTKAVDLDETQKGGLQINISVGDMKKPVYDIEEAQYEEVN